MQHRRTYGFVLTIILSVMVVLIMLPTSIVRALVIALILGYLIRQIYYRNGNKQW